MDIATTLTATARTSFSSETLTFGEYLKSWLAHIHGRVRTCTYRSYEAAIRCHVQPALGGVRLADLHPLHLQQLYAQLLEGSPDKPAISSGTVLNLHLVLNNALGQAVRWQLLPTNPAKGAQPPRPRRKQHRAADPKIVSQLLEALRGHWLELPAALAIATGMRRGEVLALRWADLSCDRTSAHVNQTAQPTPRGPVIFDRPKTDRSRRTIALPTFVQPYLAKQAADQQTRRELLADAWVELDLIVDRGDGNPINPDTVSSGWSRFLRTNTLPYLRFHDLRHSHATLMLLAGIHPKIVSERLGHSSIGLTLDTYSHVLPSMQQQAADAFDELFPDSSIPPLNPCRHSGQHSSSVRTSRTPPRVRTNYASTTRLRESGH
jgi:integrase